MTEPPVTFASLLRKLRREARLTQEELAEAAALSVRAVSYLERAEVTSPQKDTVRLLADALGLIGRARAEFEAAARAVAAVSAAFPSPGAGFRRRRAIGGFLAPSFRNPAADAGISLLSG